LSLPTEHAAKIALRTQQIIGFESGITQTVDPLGGSYYIEALTDELEKAAYIYMETIEAMGGSVAAIEQGYMQEQIAKSSYEFQKKVENNEKVIVGVNKYIDDNEKVKPVFKIDDSIRKVQMAKLDQLKKERDQMDVENKLQRLSEAAVNGDNLMPHIINSVESYATLGEIADVLRKVFGEYKG
jgi:methylmalonyl-CoA mutase, N-terminal domain